MSSCSSAEACALHLNGGAAPYSDYQRIPGPCLLYNSARFTPGQGRGQTDRNQTVAIPRLMEDFAAKPWACSLHDIDWRSEGHESAKPSYLAME